jgi:hypothetical protein
MPRTAAPPKMYVVPAGTKPTYCRGQRCGKRIYFIRSAESGRIVPINCDVEGGKRPSEAKDRGQLDMLVGGEAAVHDGWGVSHFTDCVDVETFTRGRE